MNAPNKSIPDCTVFVEEFAMYLDLEPSWGIFHVSLDDGNYEFGAAEGRPDGEPFSEFEEHLIEVFDLLTPSQRQKVGTLAYQFNRAKK